MIRAARRRNVPRLAKEVLDGARRASIREVPLAELFRATEAAQRQAEPRRRGRARREEACRRDPGRRPSRTSGRSSTSRAGRRRRARSRRPHRRRCRCRPHAAARSLAAAGARSGAARSGLVFVYADGTHFVVNQEGTTIWAGWPTTSTLEATFIYLLGPILGFVLRLRGVVSLHASVLRAREPGLCDHGTGRGGKIHHGGCPGHEPVSASSPTMSLP